MQYEAGTAVKGKVTKIMNFGAFIAIEGGGSGMVHISEISDTYVKEVKDFLTEGQEVEAIVISKDENGRLGLSIRKAARRSKAEIAEKPTDVYLKNDTSGKSFEEMMHKFKSMSDDKMGDLKRGYESKRGKSGKKGKR